MFPDNLTRAEAEHRAALVETTAYAVDVDLSGRGLSDPEAQFTSVSTVSFRARTAGSTHVDLIAKRLVSVRLDGADLPAACLDGSRIALALEPGEHRLEVTAHCAYSRTGQGLHRFVDPEDGRIYLYTQFEAADARRMFACFEQPDLKARFTLTVTAPRHWTLVSNSPVVDRAELPDDLQRACFAETLPISTYLTALVAGDYYAEHSTLQAAGGELPMSLFCRQSLSPHLDAELIFAVTAMGFATFEAQFGYPYPFGKYDQAFVPQYNGGAMENVGCVTFRDEYLFRSKVTAASTDYRRDTILHELSHMWFGDLVTMRWWDDLWLKESFASWASTFAVSQNAADPTLAWAAFGSSSKTMAYRQDQLSSTHPIAADIVDLEALEYNFDQITYSKGAAVLVQLVSFVGLDAFLAGVQLYFRNHAYGNTTLTDLLACLEKTSSRDLSDWSQQWLETAGVNTLRLELETDEAGRISAAQILQTAPEDHPTLRRHRIAVGAYERAPLGTGAPGLVRTDRIEIDVAGPTTPVPALVGRLRPTALVVNDDDLSYAKVRLDPRSLAALTAELPTIASSLSRSVVWTSVWDACRDAELAPGAYVDLVLRAVSGEPGATAVRALLAQAGVAAYGYTALGRRADVTARWRDGLLRLLDDAEPGSDFQLAAVRALIVAAEPGPTVELVEGWLRGAALPPGLTLDTDLRWLLLSSLARLGRIGEAEIAAEEQRDSSITGSEQAAGVRAALPTAEAKAAAWQRAVADADVPNATQASVCFSFWQRGQDDVLLPYVDRYLAVAEDISAQRNGWDTRGGQLRKNVLRNLFPWPLDKQVFLDRLDGWLSGVDLSPSTRRIILERRDDAVRALRCQLADI